MRILVDAMGGDNAPKQAVLGAVDAVELGAQIVLVGKGDEILQVLKDNGFQNIPKGIEIANADDVVDMHDDPGSVIHKRKNSSMVIGLRMLADGQGDAFVSAGSTGALLTGATLIEHFKFLNGLEGITIAIKLFKKHTVVVEIDKYFRIIDALLFKGPHSVAPFMADYFPSVYIHGKVWCLS